MTRHISHLTGPLHSRIPPRGTHIMKKVFAMAAAAFSFAAGGTAAPYSVPAACFGIVGGALAVIVALKLGRADD